ncbi:hypothetical protein GJ688_08895 [Heliobacillus mobilis]|uniref:DUF4149 domain-containing protein n=1 Tax=Heliobacterium mobile TaxID=28064 RepID=A0A6I3SJZ5_HELMO|nr:hypothetical protein [Heliobacterium mobile]MTV49095.1 hypothetical protein [Heliobacterium mobile]
MGGLLWRIAWAGIGVLMIWYFGYILGIQWYEEHRLDSLYWSGIMGTLSVILSLGYSVKKRFKTFPGRLITWLKIHVFFTIIGNFLICFHVGGRTHAIVPWAAFVLFFIVMISGQIGYFLHFYVKKKLTVEKKTLMEKGKSRDEAEEDLIWMVAGERMLSQWRQIHFPLNAALGLLIALHVLSAVYYRGW